MKALRRFHNLLSDNTFHQYLLYSLLNSGDVIRNYKKRDVWIQGKVPYLSELLNTKQKLDDYTMARKTRIPYYENIFLADKPLAMELREVLFDLPLAGRNIRVNVDNLNKLWNKDLPDSEDVESIHRFGWLLMLLVSQKHNNLSQVIMLGEKAIFSWIKQNRKPDIKLRSWDSYTVSERILNWIFFISLTEIDDSWDFQRQRLFLDSLVMQGNFLLGNLEYYGPDRTGNHLFKNGQALYILGSVMKFPIFHDAGKLIIQNHYRNIFTGSGLFAEDSSHYHLLVTKWLLEILQAATVTNDDSMVQWIKPKVISALKGAGTLLVFSDRNIHIPLIGDVSPDYPPEWLSGIQDVALQCFKLGSGSPVNISETAGWHSLFKNSNGFKKPAGTVPDPGSLEPEEGWMRLDKGIFTAFWHCNPYGSPKSPGHAHQDTGSFVFFSRGEPVFVDTGRKSYNNTAESRFGTSVYAHNNLIINGKEPYPRFRLFYSKAFLNKLRKDMETPQISKEYYGNRQVTVISYGVYQGLRDYGKVKRMFSFDENTFSIDNKIEGTGNHTVEIVLHTPCEIEFGSTPDKELLLTTSASGEQYTLNIDGDGLKDINLINGADKKNFGWWYPKYGYSEKINSIIISFQSNFPWNGTITFQPLQTKRRSAI